MMGNNDLNATGIERPLPLRHIMFPALWALVIFALHALPGNEVPQQDWLRIFQVDKVVHLSMFAVLSLSLFIALGKSGVTRKYKIVVLIGCVLYGIVLEMAQDVWFLDRYASVADILADTVGVFIGRIAFRGIYGCWN